MQALISVLIALVGGIAICMQSLFSGTIGRLTGVMESVFIVHLGGLFLASVILLFMRGGKIGAWQSIPWYALCAGFIGVVIVGAISYAVPRLGLATALTLSVIAQLVLGALLAHFGLFGVIQRPLDLSRVAGILILFIGTWLIIR